MLGIHTTLRAGFNPKQSSHHHACASNMATTNDGGFKGESDGGDLVYGNDLAALRPLPPTHCTSPGDHSSSSTNTTNILSSGASSTEHSKCDPQAVKKATFLDLPGELRNRIYGLLLPDLSAGDIKVGSAVLIPRYRERWLTIITTGRPSTP
jgi:hypothetical protein